MTVITFPRCWETAASVTVCCKPVLGFYTGHKIPSVTLACAPAHCTIMDYNVNSKILISYGGFLRSARKTLSKYPLCWNR